MKAPACTLLVMVLTCLTVGIDGQRPFEGQVRAADDDNVRAAGDDTGDISDTPIVGNRQEMFRDVGPRRSVLVGVEVYCGKLLNYNIEAVLGIRPIYLDAQGHEKLGGLHGTNSGGPPLRVKAKKGYAVGAISVRAGIGIDGLSLTFMKRDKGRLDPDQTYESEWLGGNGGGGARPHLSGTCAVVVGLFGSQNNNSELNGLGLVLSNKPIIAANPQTKQNRSPLPNEAAQAKALKLAKEVYGQAWTAAKIPSQKHDLAQKFLHGADESENDPVGRYILLKLARDTATQASDVQLAFEAIDKMAEQFQVDDVEMKMTVLIAVSKRTKLPADHMAIGEQAAGLIDGAIAHDKIDLAIKLGELALPEARASRDPDLLRDVNARIEQCKVLGKAYREMKEAEAVLDTKPDDPLANLTVGKYYCFQKADWEKGLPMLALGRDESLKAVAAREIAGLTKADDQVKVGDAWWDLAEKEHGKVQAALRGRANYWYQQVLPELSGLAKARLEKRIKECETASEASEGPAATKRPAKYLPGLVAVYFNDPSFMQRATARVDANLDFDWGVASPDQSMNSQNYSIRWLGYIKAPKTGRYVIHARGHYDYQIMIDKNLVIANQVTSHRISNQQADINLTAGYHLLAAQFVHGYGLANFRVAWQTPGDTGSTAIPEQNLFHDQRQAQAVGISGR